eukprot:Hpha_TRINITY_DN16706_c1_g8::TRINITY_DN16706_c1_g8_i2::g.78777::m.78777/K07304/msrA; peptide-methionine (S)-S-oxide reductase
MRGEMGVRPCLIAECQSPSLPCRATFGMGCFWGAEASLRAALGPRVAVSVGYMGGTKEWPSHREVSFGRTGGHLEVVHVGYSPQDVRFEEILAAFFAGHDPRARKAKKQYTSAVFFHDEDQRNAALSAIASAVSPVLTIVLPATQFWPAEPKHQQYKARVSGRRVCIDPDLLCSECWLAPHLPVAYVDPAACSDSGSVESRIGSRVVVAEPLSEGFGLVGIMLGEVEEDGTAPVELGGRYGVIRVRESELQSVQESNPEEGLLCVVAPRPGVPPDGCTGSVVRVYDDGEFGWETQGEQDNDAAEPPEWARALLIAAACGPHQGQRPGLQLLIASSTSPNSVVFRLHPQLRRLGVRELCGVVEALRVLREIGVRRVVDTEGLASLVDAW